MENKSGNKVIKKYTRFQESLKEEGDGRREFFFWSVREIIFVFKKTLRNLSNQNDYPELMKKQVILHKL